MADLEINDLDFYQTDYTNASPWETFNFNLEEVLATLVKREVRNGLVLIFSGSLTPLSVFQSQFSSNSFPKWTFKREEIRLHELLIEVTLYKRDPEENDTAGGTKFTFSTDSEMGLDFTLPPLWKWYCLSSFIVVTTKDHGIIPEHHLKTIQSSITMAVAEINCSIPVFVKVVHKKAEMYLGVSDQDHIRTNYDIIYLRSLPANYKCFNGLYEIFKGKVGLISLDPIQVAVRVCFSTNELKDFLELDKQLEPDDLRFPFGIQTDPIKFVLLHCVWPELPSSVVLHNYTNFDATKATDWIVQCVFDDNSIEILSDFIEELTNELMNEDALITGSDFETLLPSGFKKARQNVSKLRGQRSTDVQASIPEDVLRKFLYYIFPDADEMVENNYPPDLTNTAVLLNKLKTGPKDSLIHRLSLVLALSYSNFGGEYALKYFWNEFFSEIRYRVDHSIEIPG